MRNLLAVAFIASFFLCGCNRHTGANDDNLQAMVPGKLIRFDKELFALSPTDIDQAKVDYLSGKYGDFFTLYCTGILSISRPGSREFIPQLKAFLSHDIVKEAHEQVAAEFGNVADINDKLEEGFKNYSKHFAGSLTPKVYTYISGFNQPLMLTDSAVGVSLDMFLGRKYVPYSQLGIARYKQKNMYKERIPVEVIKAWAVGEYPYNGYGKPLLASMIHEGKLMYYVKTLLPSEADTVVAGYTKEQLSWCVENEKALWMDLVENKLLFETSYNTVSRMIEDAPFTPNLSPDSPGRVACWVGYRIVQEYMKESRASLAELMEEQDYKRIMEESRYNP